MTLDIDRMLTEDAEEWRSNLPPDDGPEAMLHGARRPRRYRRRVLAVAGSVAAVLVIVSVVVGMNWSSSPRSTSPGTQIVQRSRSNAGLTAAQKTLALQIAHQEAIGSIPDGSPVTHGMWPLNVDSVSVLVTTATDGAQYVGGSTAATGKVLVIRLSGRFSLATSGPRGSGNANGNELTVLVSLTAGRVSDSGVETHHPPADLPNSTVLFSR